MKKILKLAGIISSMCLGFYPFVSTSIPSFLLFGEIPLPEDK